MEHLVLQKNVFHVYNNDAKWNALPMEKHIINTTIANIRIDMEFYLERVALLKE